MTFSRNTLTRMTVTLPADLLREVDRMAGRRGRSRYVAEAVEQRVRRDMLRATIHETAGAMLGQPGWMNPEETAAFASRLRSEDPDA